MKQPDIPQTAPKQLAAHYKVDRLAWGIAIASLGAAITIIYLVVHFATTTYRQMHLEKFYASLAGSHTTEALDHLRQLFDGPPVLNLLPGSAARRPTVARETAEDLVTSLGTLSPEQLFGADQKLALAVERARQQAKNPSKSIQILDQLRATLRPLLTQQELLQKRSADRALLLNERNRALSQLALITRDVTDLFSLPPRSLDPQEVAPSFYGAGILKGLPALPELPDDLASFGKLREQLNHLGGRLPASDGQMAESLLAARISSLRQGADAISTTVREVDSKLSNIQEMLESDHDQLEQQLGMYSDQLRDKLRELIE